jgi:hypothetical protein
MARNLWIAHENFGLLGRFPLIDCPSKKKREKDENPWIAMRKSIDQVFPSPELIIPHTSIHCPSTLRPAKTVY